MSTPSECIPRFNSHCECEQQDNDRPRTVGRRRGEGRGPSIWLAARPAEMPPLAEPGGPLNMAGTRMVIGVDMGNSCPARMPIAASEVNATCRQDAR